MAVYKQYVTSMKDQFNFDFFHVKHKANNKNNFKYIKNHSLMSTAIPR